MRRYVLISLLVATSGWVGCGLDSASSEGSELAGGGPSLLWVGDTHLRIGTVWLPPTLEPPADQPLAVYTQTYPIGAASEVELSFKDATAAIHTITMQHDADHVGAFGNNSQWRAAIPASVMHGGQRVEYWIRAADTDGHTLWDSRNGGNFSVVARDYAIGWIGGLGSFRPVNGDYQEGGMVNADGSTSTGCWNHGVSASSYRELAARIWIPGLTDRNLDTAELAAAAAMIDLEVFTNARPEGWTKIPARFARRGGNDFIYSFRFVDFTPVCVPGLDDGTYEFKLRASTTDGTSWFWRGSSDGPLGGTNLRVQYAARCGYFNDPYDCIPTETELTHRLPGGPVRRWDGTAIGATSTFTKELIGGDQPVTVSQITLTGPDADQFQLEVFDVGANQLVDPAGPFTLGSGDELRLILVHAPTRASVGVLPQQASIMWVENGSVNVQGIFLRARTAP